MGQPDGPDFAGKKNPGSCLRALPVSFYLSGWLENGEKNMKPEKTIATMLLCLMMVLFFSGCKNGSELKKEDMASAKPAQSTEQSASIMDLKIF